MPSSQQTKQCFVQSMKQLLAHKPLEEISVGDIAAHSGMSRNTFYYHFQDKYDLVNWIFRTESAAFLAKAPTRDNWQDILRQLCRYFEENRAFYRNALAYTGQNSLREYLFDTFSGVVQQHLKSADSKMCIRDRDGPDEDGQTVFPFHKAGDRRRPGGDGGDDADGRGRGVNDVSQFCAGDVVTVRHLSLIHI